MSYSQIAISSVLFAISYDLFILRCKLILKKAFWISYAIILPFQLLTNWWLTSRNIVMYQSSTIWGLRIAAAPAEDLLFGFSLILLTLDNWVSVTRKSNFICLVRLGPSAKK
jgi:lycopene cyclase domain-containing protein